MNHLQYFIPMKSSQITQMLAKCIIMSHISGGFALICQASNTARAKMILPGATWGQKPGKFFGSWGWVGEGCGEGSRSLRKMVFKKK